MADGLILGGRYRLEEPVGSGGFCEVWRATDVETGARVAVKRVRAGAVGGSREAASQHLASEAAVLREVRHPAVVELADFGFDDGWPFLVMEYLDGPTLLEEVRRTGGLPPETVIEIGADLAEALHHAHSLGFVHNDVKPANVVLAGRAKLTDFGTSRDLDQTLPPMEARVVAGTLAYLAPELLDGSPPGPQSDVYALAVTLFEALTGQLPFGRPGSAVAAGAARTVTPLRALLPSASAALERLLGCALSSDPRQRPASAREFARGLRAAVPGKPPVFATGRPSRPRGIAARRRVGAGARRRAAASALAGLMLGLVGMTVLFAAGGGGAPPEPGTPREEATAIQALFPDVFAQALPSPPAPTPPTAEPRDTTSGRDVSDTGGGGVTERDEGSGAREKPGRGNDRSNDDGRGNGNNKKNGRN